MQVFLEVCFCTKQMSVQTPAIWIASTSKTQMQGGSLPLFSDEIIAALWMLLSVSFYFKM